ncbi:MAG: pyridoxal phosphate-dependent aminotransferase [Atribacterota bacterium]|nr:pyridoxal phosphate-dependent aminotransferase [Atribacterota bacterium]
MQIAHRMNLLGTETAFEVLAEVNKLKAAGKDIISFAIGEPDFDTPSNIIKAGIQALQEGYTHYGPSAGLMPFRESIARYVSHTRNIEVNPEEVVITPGAKPIIFFSILACVNEGDEVIYPNPGFPIYESVINFIGARAIPLPLLEEKNFRFNIEVLKEKISNRTRMIIINSPQNPTGGILTEEDLQEIAALAIKNSIWIFSDEIYCNMVYDGKFRSIISLPGMKERTILLDGFSKTYAMTGWRLGFGVMNTDLATHFTRLETNSVSCTATFTQMAGIEALEGPQEESQEMIKEFKARRDIIVEALNDIEGVTCQKPGGAFYVFPNVTEACQKLKLKNSKEFQQYLLYEAGVAVLARTCFGRKNQEENQEYIRLSYATSRENILEGVRRIKKAVER